MFASLSKLGFAKESLSYPPSSLQSMSLRFCITRSRLRSRYVFYWGAKQDFPKPGNLWHDAMAVGKEKLRTMVRDMCADAGIVEKTCKDCQVLFLGI